MNRRRLIRYRVTTLAVATMLDLVAASVAMAAPTLSVSLRFDAVSMVGDSLTAGSRPAQLTAFEDVGWATSSINAFPSRGVRTKVAADAHTGLTAVDAIRSRTGDTSMWIVALGTTTRSCSRPADMRS